MLYLCVPATFLNMYGQIRKRLQPLSFNAFSESLDFAHFLKIFTAFFLRLNENVSDDAVFGFFRVHTTIYSMRLPVTAPSSSAHKKTLSGKTGKSE